MTAGIEKAGEFLIAGMDDEDDARLCRDIPEGQCREQPRNFLLQIGAQALAKCGDNLANPKVVLPWLLGAVGAPAFMVGLLVPIRESLALLPQILIGGIIRRFSIRKWFWVASSVVEGVSVVLMGLVAIMGLSGWTTGWSVLGLLAIFSIARGVASVGSKDTLAKTVSKGRRGRVSGVAASASGIVALGFGAYLVWGRPDGQPVWILLAILIMAGLCWIAASAIYANIVEYPGATDGARGIGDLAREQFALLADDPDFRKFLIARSLLVSTALAGPVFVTLAQQGTGSSLSGLGWMVLATGAASFSSSWLWGLMSDVSSRRTMVVAAILTACAALAVIAIPVFSERAGNSILFYAFCLYVAAIGYAGVRIGRKTHIVDMARGDRKAEYVALSNTLIGVVLVVVGAATSLLLSVGPQLALACLALASLAGAGMAAAMRDAQS